MAAPITHIFLAIQVLSGPLAHRFDEKEFIIGTSFPDIRYLHCIERTQTHFSHVTLDDIKNETNAFKAGMLFHSLVDEVREDYISSTGFYERLPQFRFISQAMKFAEDKIALSIFDSKPYSDYFDTILDEERDYVGEADIKKWHGFLKKYFSGQDSLQEMIRNFSEIGLCNVPFYKRWLYRLYIWYYEKKIENTVVSILNDDAMREQLLRFYEDFSKNISLKSEGSDRATLG